MTRIHMSTGSYFDVDYDVDRALDVRVRWDTPHAAFVEFDRWIAVQSWVGDRAPVYHDERLILNINHIVRLEPL